MNIKTVIPALAILGGTSLLFVTTVHAQATTPSQSIADRIAKRFNLNTSDVVRVFEEERAAHQKEMQDKFNERLTQAVANGTITQSQKDALLTKHQEMQKAHEELRNVSPEERKTRMRTLHEAYIAWAKEQGITDEVLQTVGMRQFARGFGMGFMKGFHMGKNR